MEPHCDGSRSLVSGLLLTAVLLLPASVRDASVAQAHSRIPGGLMATLAAELAEVGGAAGLWGYRPGVGSSEPQEVQKRETRPATVTMMAEQNPRFLGVARDLFLWGYDSTLAGSVEDNAFAGGRFVRIERGARVEGDLFLFGETATIEGEVSGDVYYWCRTLRIEPGAVVRGDLRGGSEMLRIAGDVQGAVHSGAGLVEINGTVGSDVSLDCGTLEIGPQARIDGELKYDSPRPARIDSGAVIGGPVRHVEPARAEEEKARGGFSWWALLWKLWLYASSFLVGAVLLALGGEAARRPARSLGRQPARGLGFGFVVAVVLPAGAFLAVLLVITLPLGILALMLYVVTLYIARLVTAQCVGGWMLRHLRRGAGSSAYFALALGLLAFYLVTAIPYVGFLLWIASLVAGLGGLFLASRDASPRGVSAGRAPISA
ncbi:MAG: polymer-forming cytoskeletal protein [Acidobacteriota bacterium]